MKKIALFLTYLFTFQVYAAEVPLSSEEEEYGHKSSGEEYGIYELITDAIRESETQIEKYEKKRKELSTGELLANGAVKGNLVKLKTYQEKTKVINEKISELREKIKSLFDTLNTFTAPSAQARSWPKAPQTKEKNKPTTPSLSLRKSFTNIFAQCTPEELAAIRAHQAEFDKQEEEGLPRQKMIDGSQPPAEEDNRPLKKETAI